nr:hypothetical protein [Candidatus Gracilibacteria bacterium]
MTRLSYNSRRSRVKKTLKDYLIPGVGILIIFIIIFSIFSGGNSENTGTGSINNQIDSINNLNVTLDDATTEAYIIDEKEKKQVINGSSVLLPSQRVVVKEGTVTIESNDSGTFKLNKMGELSLDQNGGIKLISSDLWLNVSKALNIETIYSKVKISAGSVISISQNEALSTIYVISGSAEVSNLVGQKTLLGNLQKLTISNQDASNKSIDLSINKDNIDDFFKNSEWYVKNNGDSFINNVSSSGSSGASGSVSISDGNSIIELDDLRDEGVVSSDKLNITGKYYNDFVSSITLDGNKAKLNTDDKTFSFSSIMLTKKENDLVFKLYDTDNNIISKVVYTIYYNGAVSQQTTDYTAQPSTTGFEVTNYQVDGSKFIFTAPGESPYTTTESLVTIRGQVPAGIVNKVVVNGFTLGSFNGTTWRYHADVNNDNLKEGTNVYEIKYYGDGGKLIYTNSYIIIKKVKLIQPTEGTTETSSGDIAG